MSPRFAYACRLNSFKARPDLFQWEHRPGDIRDVVRRAGLVKEMNSIVFNYPEHFVEQSTAGLRDAVARTHLTVRGINLRYPEPQFSEGAFTNPSAELREAAVRLTCDAVDACRELGARHVMIWLGNDGWDYPFQMDYSQAWAWEVEGIRAVADYAAQAGDGMRISIEYKPSEPRRFSLLADVGTTLLAVEECGRENVGVALDYCHMLMAGENPATSAALCIRKGLLYGLHLNDGYGALDDGLMVGSVTLPQLTELMYHVCKSDYDDIVYFDTFPLREDPVQECAANIRRLEEVIAVVDRLDGCGAAQALADQDGLAAQQSLWKATLTR